MSSGVNVGVVGYGYAGRCFHSYLVGLADGLNLYAVSSRDEERRNRAKADHGVKTFATLDEMLEDPKVELVVIGTPHDTHEELAIRAMDAGRHVVADKVMCMNAAEADRMIEASRRNSVMLSVFHNRRWDGDFLTVKHAMESGLLGEVFLIESTIFGYGQPGGWRGEKQRCGGQLYDWGAHLVDQALLLVPSEVETVFCDCQYRKWQTDTDSHLTLCIRFANSALAMIELSRLARIGKPRWYVLGEKGSLLKEGRDPQEPAMVAGNIDAAREDPATRAQVKTELDGIVTEMRLETIPGRWRSYYENISAVLNDGAELAVKPEGVRKAMAVIDAAMESAAKGVAIEPDRG